MIGSVGNGIVSVAGIVYVLDKWVSEASRSNTGTGDIVYDHGSKLGFPEVYRDALGTEDGTGWSIVNHKTERQSLELG